MEKIIINGEEYVKSSLVLKKDDVTKYDYVLIRSSDAGVFVGYLKSFSEKTAVLLDSQNIWSWQGACGVSQIAVDGFLNPNDEGNRITVVVQERLVSNVCEVLKVTEKAFLNIKSVPIWKK